MAMPQSKTILSLGFLALVMGCASAPPPAENPPSPSPSSLAPAPIEVTKSPAAEAPAAAPKSEKPTPPTPLFRVSEGIRTPESVLYDEVNDRYLVSNINGSPDQADNNGYISELSADGKLLREKFIAGGVGKVKLDAPKGTGVSAGILYVADITVVRLFDLKTGAPKGEIPVPGSTFLNDVAVSKDGRIFVSDSGLKVGPNGFDPTGTDAVYEINKGKLRTVAKSKDLGGPNGLLAVDDGVLVVTFNSDELYRLDEKGVKQQTTKLPQGGLDGIARTRDSLLVSSWKGSAVYRGTLGGSFVLVLSGLNGPADITFDNKRQRVLVPRFLESAVEAYDLK